MFIFDSWGIVMHQTNGLQQILAGYSRAFARGFRARQSGRANPSHALS
jgi:hypothetical protein